MITRYDYNELYNAVKDDPTPENIENLVYWLDMFDYWRSWNGEAYYADDLKIVPVYNDNDDIIGYDIF